MSDHDALVPRPTKQELEDARTRGQVIGWLQGAGAVVALGLLLKIVGWVPLLVVGGAAAYLAWRMLGRKSK